MQVFSRPSDLPRKHEVLYRGQRCFSIPNLILSPRDQRDNCVAPVTKVIHEKIAVRDGRITTRSSMTLSGRRSPSSLERCLRCS
jgi:hypothetical protein